MKKLITYFYSFIYSSLLFSQIPLIEWQKSLGGTNDDGAGAVAFTIDGGCVVAGGSFSNNGDVTGNHGGGDIWVIKLNVDYEIEWQKCLGGSDKDRAASIMVASDGGYIVAGTTESDDGDVSNFHGWDDIWVVKLDETGNIQWEKTYGNFDSEQAYCMSQTSDLGYIIAGTGGTCNNHQGLIIKINGIGEVEWEKEVGGYGTEQLYSIKQDHDGNFVFAGYSQSYSIGGYLSYDFYVGLLDSQGNLKWHNRYGGKYNDRAYSIDLSHNGGYIVAGMVGSNDGDVTGNHGDEDYWIIEIDKEGNLLWQKCYGGTSVEWAYSIKSLENNEYVVVGKTFSNNGDILENHGQADFWILKIDQTGNIIFNETYGGSKSDIAYSIDLRDNSELIVAGASWSDDGDITGHHGTQDHSDYWVVNLSLTTGTKISFDNKFEMFSIIPNPAGNFVTIQSEIKIRQVTIMNNLGEVVFTKENPGELLRVNTSGFPGGIYLVRFHTFEGILFKKLIIN